MYSYNSTLSEYNYTRTCIEGTTLHSQLTIIDDYNDCRHSRERTLNSKVTMKTQIIALLLAVFLATVNAFGVPTQMALGGVNGGKIHKSDLSRIKSFITWNGTCMIPVFTVGEILSVLSCHQMTRPTFQLHATCTTVLTVGSTRVDHKTIPHSFPVSLDRIGLCRFPKTATTILCHQDYDSTIHPRKRLADGCHGKVWYLFSCRLRCQVGFGN